MQARGGLDHNQEVSGTSGSEGRTGEVEPAVDLNRRRVFVYIFCFVFRCHSSGQQSSGGPVPALHPSRHQPIPESRRAAASQ